MGKRYDIWAVDRGEYQRFTCTRTRAEARKKKASMRGSGHEIVYIFQVTPSGRKLVY